MQEPYWRCPRCGFTSPMWEKYYWRCPRCGSPLELVYTGTYEPRGSGVRRYASSLPLVPDRSVGEGSTPLIVDEYRGRRLLYKLEYMNPTGSFKDRGTALAIYYAYKMGYDSAVEDTSGNTGISVALYSRIYGLKASIIVPRTAPDGKKRLVRLLGGRIVEADKRGDAPRIAAEMAEHSFYVAHTWSPLFALGASTIVFEVYDQGEEPDTVIIPVGSGSLFLGIMYGFEFLYKNKLIKKIPRPIAVQGFSEQSLYRAIYGKIEKGGKSLLADGIMVPDPPRIEEVKDYILKYRGDVVLVDDNQIIKALRKLIDRGFIVEPTSATVLAALDILIEKGVVEKGSTILLPLTGSGLKMYSELHAILGEPADRGPV